MGIIDETIKESGTVAKATTEATFKAVSILIIPLLELVIMAGIVVAIVDLPRRLLDR
jgi:hypothetical protein